VTTFKLLYGGTGAKSQMARIIYAPAGEGFGHASRMHLIARRFLDAGHEVMFASSHRGPGVRRGQLLQDAAEA